MSGHRRMETSSSALGLNLPEYHDVGARANGLASRQLGKHIWNPYHELLIPTIHFYRYDGSLTEPPCGEFVSWFISDKPMIVSFEQLAQWRNIQFAKSDPTNCVDAVVDEINMVSRPLQNTNDRKVWVCTTDDFVKDP